MNNKEKRLRIAMLGQKHALSNEGGVEVVVREISTRMVALGHEVTCYNRGGHHVSGREYDGDWRCAREYEGVRMKTVPTIHRRGFAAMTSSFFAALFAAFGRYDVVHFHAEGPCAMIWLPKLFGKRCIATVHGIDWKREKWADNIGSKYIKFGEKCAAKYADEIIVLSENVQKYFLDAYGRKTVFISNGVNRPKIRESDEIKSRWNLEKNDYILFLGRLVPEKGLRYLIEAYKDLLKCGGIEKKLVVAGGGSDADAFAKELKYSCKDIENHIIFTGFIHGKVLDELYSNAYFYVLPSDLEGMPLSLLEAMSYGNCCVVSDIEECVSVVGDKAVIFRKSDAEDLKEKLKALLDNPALVQEYKDASADFVCEKYSWDEAVKGILKLYGGYESYTESRVEIRIEKYMGSCAESSSYAESRNQVQETI